MTDDQTKAERRRYRVVIALMVAGAFAVGVGVAFMGHIGWLGVVGPIVGAAGAVTCLIGLFKFSRLVQSMRRRWNGGEET